MKTYLLFPFLIFLVLTSCSTARIPDSYENKMNTTNEYKSSKFSGFTELGISKEALTETFGEPTSKDMFRENDQLIEVLHYVEFLDNNKIVLTTKFTFEDNVLKEQKTISDTSNLYKQELENLKLQLNGIRHQLMFK